jgi:hypothetical protein
MLAAAGCGAPRPPEPQSAAPPEPARPPTAAERQFTGVWVPTGTFDDPAGPPPWSNTRWPAKPPFTEWGAAESARLADHSTFTPCTPNGPVYQMWEIGLFPLQILEAPDQIVILREASPMPRRIYTDGRGHPEDVEPTWMGHSIGRWDGDVLVVDTVGTNGKARAVNGVGANARVSAIDQEPRLPVSDELHLVERLRLVADGQLLEDEITLEDPKTYREPIVVKHYFHRRPDIDMLEYYCNDNPRASDDTSVSAAADTAP